MSDDDGLGTIAFQITIAVLAVCTLAFVSLVAGFLWGMT